MVMYNQSFSTHENTNGLIFVSRAHLLWAFVYWNRKMVSEEDCSMENLVVHIIVFNDQSGVRIIVKNLCQSSSGEQEERAT